MFAKIAAVLLGLALFIPLAGCSPSTGDEIVATVEGTPVCMWEVSTLYIQNKDHYGSLKSPAIDLDDPNNYLEKRQTLQTILEQVINNKVMYLCAVAEGYGLTEEELAQVDADIEANTQKQIDFFVETIYKGQEDERQKALDHYINYLDEYSLNLDRLKQLTIEEKVIARLTDKLMKDEDAYASEELIYKSYLAGIEEQKEAYEQNPEQYAEDIRFWSQNHRAFYAPYESKRVKYLRMPFTQDVQAQLNDLEAKKLEINDQLPAIIEAALQSNDDSEMDAAIKELDQIEKKIAALGKEGTQKSEQQAREIYAQVTSENFEDMIEQYSTDEAMNSYDGRTFGIIVYDGAPYYEEFKKAAMALTQNGELSDLIQTDGGWFVIKLIETIPQGNLPYEELKEHIAFTYDFREQSDLVMRYAQEQKQSMKIKRNLEKLK